MNAREQILARVRAALAADAPPAPAVSREYRRVAPADATTVLARFADRVTEYRAGLHRADRAHLPATLTRLLFRTATLVVPADLPPDWLAGYAGPVRRDGDPALIPTAELDQPAVSVLTGCAVAIAETGTIVLDTGPAQGRRVLTLVPDHHVCVVTAGQVLATVPAALAALADPTRPLTFISGPSATSDIELNRVEGVHGPRRLDVVLLSR